MDKLVYTAATGLRAHMQAQAAIANNMANASTTGLTAFGLPKMLRPSVIR